MKLSALKTAIRQHNGSVEVWSSRLEGWFAVQKGSFIEALERKFEAKNAETYLRLDDDGKIQSEENA